MDSDETQSHHKSLINHKHHKCLLLLYTVDLYSSSLYLNPVSIWNWIFIKTPRLNNVIQHELCLSVFIIKTTCHTLLPLEKFKYGKLDTHQTNKKNDKLHSFWPVAQNFSLPFFSASHMYLWISNYLSINKSNISSDWRILYTTKGCCYKACINLTDSLNSDTRALCDLAFDAVGVINCITEIIRQLHQAQTFPASFPATVDASLTEFFSSIPKDKICHKLSKTSY